MLLTNNIGSNLRNAVAHGLLDDDTASGGMLFISGGEY
jgi:hypothetical protein